MTAAGAGFGLWAVVPDFFLGPYADVDDMVQEYLSGHPWDRGAWSLFAANPDFFGYFLLPGVLATAWAVRSLRRQSREACLALLVAMASTATFAFVAARLIVHYMLFVSIPLGGAAVALGRLVWNRASGGLRALAGIVVLGVMLSPYLVSWPAISS